MSYLTMVAITCCIYVLFSVSSAPELSLTIHQFKFDGKGLKVQSIHFMKFVLTLDTS